MHEPSGLESFESGGASSPSPLESARVSWRLESLGGRRRCVGTVVVPRAQLHTEQEKTFTGVVDTWRVGTNQQYLYSIGEYLIFAWLFQRKKVACRGILTAQDSSPLDSARVSWRLESARVRSSRLVNNTTGRDDTVGPSDEGKRGVSGARDSMPRKVRVSFSSSVEAAPVIANGHFPVQ